MVAGKNQALTVSNGGAVKQRVTLSIGGPASPAQECSSLKLYIHESLLTNNSPVFRAMLSQPAQNANESLTTWTEARTKNIRLPEDRVADWAVLAKWLYSGGSETNTLSANDVEQLNGLSLLAQVVEKQPGLTDSTAMLAAFDYVTWRQDRDSRRGKTTVDVSKPPPSSRFHPYRLHEQALEKIKAGVAAEDVEKELDCIIVGAADIAGKEGRTEPEAPRPAPPALGPLVRLYILADKYAMDESARRSSLFEPRSPSPASSDSADAATARNPNITSIKVQIILRLRAINKLANVVPDREDIERLWSNIIDKHDPLKLTIIEIYARLTKKSLERIIDSNNTNITRSETDVKWSVVNGAEDVEWHPGFLRQLLVRRESGLSPSVAKSEKDKRRPNTISLAGP
ncbi:hypothetical protein LTR70_005317 [Exophiala xenobiotica]|uniref:BTB domain-containing protein n=1 Tax=Lithohypha guttulata TaxID=1690604 RepID=A0ABR0JYP8_9EURO|nr:hypothetical protein LTR24_008851 [Lithohypha guttulata]KAK5318753.1 hypothetical protein LTR70_005317 [Exophiala xenobiotica]